MATRNSKPFYRVRFFTECSCSLRVMTLFLWFAPFMLNKLFIFGFLTCRIFIRNSTSAPLRQPFWTVSTPDFANSFRCNKTSLQWRKLPYDFGTALTTSGCGPFFRCLRTIQLLGFGTSLNSIVAASTQYSFHLPIFQLPERPHCTASFLVDTPIRHLFSMA